jgi:uncharacterized protein YegP (UPF0339 family)
MKTTTEIYKDSKNKWRWRKVAANGQVVASSHQGYTRKYNAAKNARKQNA